MNLFEILDLAIQRKNKYQSVAIGFDEMQILLDLLQKWS